MTVARPALAAAVLISGAVLVPAAADAAGDGRRPLGTAGTAAVQQSGGAPQPVNSSDDEPGVLVAPLGAGALAPISETTVESYRVVPGLRYRHWLRTDARGTVDAYLLRANLEKPGLTLRYAGLEHVSDRAVLTDVLARDEAVAGVNADFFDIDDTGAPLGVGIDGGRILHGQRAGWITSFTVTGRSGAAIGQQPVTPVVVDRPKVRLTDLNSPYIREDGIGLYTPRWGTAPGYAVTDGAPHRYVRQVVVRDGRVVANSRTVTSGAAIRGKILIGRGKGAGSLARELPVGSRVGFRTSSPGSPRVAVSGSEVLVRDGEVVVTDDTELHPRTAVGIDADTGRVLLVVVDGRSESSSGYTLVQLARLLTDLGAEDALNLDGGGSSTMAVQPPGEALQVANVPSDGEQRPVPEGLELVYDGSAAGARR